MPVCPQAYGNYGNSSRALNEVDESRLKAHAIRLHEARVTLGLSSISELSTFHLRNHYVNKEGRKRGLYGCPPGYERSYGGRQMHSSEDQQETRHKIARALGNLPICCSEGDEPYTCEYGIYCATTYSRYWNCGSCYHATQGGNYCDCTCTANEQYHGVC